MEAHMIHFWAVLALILAGAGTTLGQWILVIKAMDILWRNPRIYQSLLIFTILSIALVEASAIYGLITALKISGAGKDIWTSLAAGLAVGIPCFLVGYIEWKVAAEALEAMNRNPENTNSVLQLMILTMALIEAVAIYGLVVAFKLLA